MRRKRHETRLESQGERTDGGAGHRFSGGVIDGEVEDDGNACRTWRQLEARLDAGERSLEREYVPWGADGWYVVCREAEGDIAGRQGPLATTAEVGNSLDTITLGRAPAGRRDAGDRRRRRAAVRCWARGLDGAAGRRRTSVH